LESPVLEMCGKHLRRRFAVKAKQSGWVPTTEKHPGIATKLGTNVRVGTIAQAVLASKVVDFRVPMRAFLRIAASVNNYADKIIVDATNVLAQAAQD
jgi:predicted dinucleotide-binding enzyme